LHFLYRNKEYGNIWFSELRQQIDGSLVQSVTPRTAGFNTIDIGKMTTAGLFITIALMFIGASPGGTGGGLKTTTIRVLTSCQRQFYKVKRKYCFMSGK